MPTPKNQTRESAQQLMDSDTPKLLKVKSARFHSAVQFEGGLGAKAKINAGECGCELFWIDQELVVKLPKHNDQIVPNVMVLTLL